MIAAWLPMLATDARDQWDPHVLGDARVTQFWDGDRALGRFLADDHALDYPGPVMWDAFLLFGPDARWDQQPPTPIAKGWPVVAATDRLTNVLQRASARTG